MHIYNQLSVLLIYLGIARLRVLRFTQTAILRHFDAARAYVLRYFQIKICLNTLWGPVSKDSPPNSTNGNLLYALLL